MNPKADLIDLLNDIRNRLRAGNSFVFADRIRDSLEGLGVEVGDRKLVSLKDSPVDYNQMEEVKFEVGQQRDDLLWERAHLVTRIRQLEKESWLISRLIDILVHTHCTLRWGNIPEGIEGR